MSRNSEKTTAVLTAALEPIIAAIEDGIAHPNGWTAPWHRSGDDLMPYCPATDRHYTAGNRFMLAAVSMFFGAEPHWGTYNQWKGMSKHTRACNKTASNTGKRNEARPDCGDDCHLVNVRKGEKSIAYAFRPLTRREENDDGTYKSVLYGFAPFAVFHSGQVDGYTMPVVEPPAAVDADSVAEAFEFARSLGADVNESPYEGAFYRPVTDTITMPERSRWTDVDGAWSTMVHELTHWTGHKSRLGRDLTGRFGDDAYATEELVAELGAAFTLATLGRSAEPREDHAHYLASWLKVLKADPKHLMTVASHAEKASKFLLDLVPEVEEAPAELVAA